MLTKDGILTKSLLYKAVGTGEKISSKITTDPKYGIDFILIQGFIEVVQNALDIMDIDKADVDIFYEFGRMYITNTGPSLGIDDLDIGQTTKRDDVTPWLPRGYFGTGLSKAVAVFLKFGYKMEMFSKYGLYKTEIKSIPSEKYGKVDRIIVSTYDRKIPEGTIITISGPDMYDIYKDLESRIVELKDVKLIANEYPKVKLVDEHVPIDEYEKEKSVFGRGYHRGIFITKISTIFNYNFCDRTLMTQESRNSFTNTWDLAGQVARYWRATDNYDLIKKFISYSIRLSGVSYDESRLEYYKPDKYKKLWYDAWTELYPGKYATSMELVALSYPGKFILVPSFLYEILKECGVPTEGEAHIERIDTTIYKPSSIELERLYIAIEIASLYAGKKTDESIKIRNTLKSILPNNIYSKAIIVDKYGKKEDKTGEWAFVWNHDIKNLYIRDMSIREFNEVRIAALIIHELGHTKEVGSLYMRPEGIGHELMYEYYESILIDLLNTITVKKLLDYFKTLEKR